MSEPSRAEDFKIESVYDFSTFASSILGTFKGVRVKGVVDHRLAYNFIDPAAMHANVYGSLPSDEVPDDFRKYQYLIVEMPNDETTAIGLPWINRSSIELRQRNRIHLTIEDVGTEDLSKVKRALESNGFTVSDIELDT